MNDIVVLSEKKRRDFIDILEDDCPQKFKTSVGYVLYYRQSLSDLNSIEWVEALIMSEGLIVLKAVDSRNELYLGYSVYESSYYEGTENRYVKTTRGRAKSILNESDKVYPLKRESSPFPPEVFGDKYLCLECLLENREMCEHQEGKKDWKNTYE